MSYGKPLGVKNGLRDEGIKRLWNNYGLTIR